MKEGQKHIEGKKERGNRERGSEEWWFCGNEYSLLTFFIIGTFLGHYTLYL